MFQRKRLVLCLMSAVAVLAGTFSALTILQFETLRNTDSLKIAAASLEIEDYFKFQPTIQCPPPRVSLPGPFFYLGRAPHGFLNQSREIPPPRCRPSTPLFIPFTSQFCLLKQTVLSYIAEGWPASQIIVVDNTGKPSSNMPATIPYSDDHSFLNYSLLLQEYGVNIYRSPTKQTFSQTQNLLIQLARAQGWPSFYQSHQDIVVRHRNESDRRQHHAFYQGILQESRERVAAAETKWAITFFHYDWLSHVNVHAASHIGLWDTLIPWYPADCDYYSRLRMKGYQVLDFDAGDVFDVASCLHNPEKQLFPPRGSNEDMDLHHELQEMSRSKTKDTHGRNTWQGRNGDGSLSEDFGGRYQTLVEAGRNSYRIKWGTNRCYVSSPVSSWTRWLIGLIRRAIG